MARLLSILLTLALLTSGVSSAEEQGLFHRAASLALGVAAKSAQKGLELDAEKRAGASPGQAEKIRRSSKLAQLGLQSVGDGLIEKATGVDVGGMSNQYRRTHEKTSRNYGQYNKAEPLLDRELSSETHNKQPKGRKKMGVESHHLPAKAFLKKHGLNSENGVSILMSENRHSRTRTYRKAIKEDETFRQSLARDINDVRRIYREDNIDYKFVNEKMKDVINLTKQNSKDFISKVKQSWQ